MAILLFIIVLQHVTCTSFNMRVAAGITESVPKFIEARHFKHGKWLLYEEINNLYDVCLYLEETSKLEYSVSLYHICNF